MVGLGKAARNAVSTGRQETIKPFPRIRSTGHDIAWWELNEVQIPGIKIGRYQPFLDSLSGLSNKFFDILIVSLEFGPGIGL